MDTLAIALGLVELSNTQLNYIYSQTNYQQITDGMSGFVGKTHSNEWKLEASLRAKNRVWSEETKTKISSSKKGVKFSEEHKAKLAAAKRGKKLSEEHKANISKNNRWNKKGEQ